MDEETGVTSALFDAHIPDDRVRSYLRGSIAAAGGEALSVTATVFTRGGEFTPASEQIDLSLLIRTSPASRKRGSDDAIFLDRNGRLGEATIWNVAYWDGSAVVWPIADVLTGVTMGILKRQLTELGEPQREVAVTPDLVGGFAGAVVMNSWTPGVPINSIAGTAIPAAPQFVELLHTAYLREPEVEI